jgi:hypothetical protein
METKTMREQRAEHCKPLIDRLRGMTPEERMRFYEVELFGEGQSSVPSSLFMNRHVNPRTGRLG